MPRTRPILRRKFLVLSGERTGSLSVNLDDFLASVCSASLARSVGQTGSAALGAELGVWCDLLPALFALDHFRLLSHDRILPFCFYGYLSFWNLPFRRIFRQEPFQSIKSII